MQATRRPTRIACAIVAWMGLLLLPACSTLRGTRLPPVTATNTGEAHVGKFVWFDLLTEDAAAAKSFYSALFGWEFDDSEGPAGYSVIRNRGNPIGGISQIKDQLEEPEALWLGSLSVADVDVAAKLTVDMGGEVIDGPVEVAGRGRMAVMRDPTGAELVALRSATGDPPDTGATVGSWLWTDLITKDGKLSREYYAALVGYGSKQVELRSGEVYHVVGRGGAARAGVVEASWPEVDSNWLPYVGVADVDAAANQALNLGGQELLRTRRLALLLDPTGAAFGIQKAAKGGTR